MVQVENDEGGDISPNKRKGAPKGRALQKKVFQCAPHPITGEVFVNETVGGVVMHDHAACHAWQDMIKVMGNGVAALQ